MAELKRAEWADRGLRWVEEYEAELNHIQYSGQLGETLRNLGVSQMDFDNRMAARTCLVCGKDSHQFRACPLYDTSNRQEGRYEGYRDGVRAAAGAGACAGAVGRDGYHRREQRFQQQQRTGADHQRQFCHGFHPNRPPAAAARVERESAPSRDTRYYAESIPADRQDYDGDVGHYYDSAGSDDSMDQLQAWQEAGPGNCPWARHRY